MKTIQITKESKIFFSLIAALILYYSYQLLSPYIATALIAFFIAVITKPIYEFFFKITKQRLKLSTSLTMLIVSLCVLLPLTLVTNMVIVQTRQFSSDVQTYFETNSITTSNIVDKLNYYSEILPYIEYEVTDEKLTRYITDLVLVIPNFIAENIGSISAFSVSFTTQFLIFVLLLIVFIPTQDKVIKSIKELSPMDDVIDNLYIDRVIATSRSMIEGTLLISFTQSSITTFVMWLIGVKYVIFWMIIMMILALIPMFGTWLVSLPIAMFLIITGNVAGGISLMITAYFVSFVDNLMRIKLVPKSAKLHPMLVLLGLLGGSQLFGITGFVFGPILMILFVTTLEIYRNYFNTKPISKSKSI